MARELEALCEAKGKALHEARAQVRCEARGELAQCPSALVAGYPREDP